MKVRIINKETKAQYKVFENAARVATRACPVNEAEEIELVVYASGHGHAFSTRFYDVVIEE